MEARKFATLGMIGIGWFVVAVLVLHVIESEFSVVNNFISDYATGSFGWLMQSAFFGAGVGTIAIGLGLHKTLVPAKRVTFSVVLLIIAGVGFFGAIAKTDPAGATESTTSSGVHVVASMVIFFTLLICVWMLRGVFTRDPTWEPFAKSQMWFAIAYTLTLVGTVVTPEDGPVGVPQRIFVPVMMAWLATLAWNIRLNSLTANASLRQATQDDTHEYRW